MDDDIKKYYEHKQLKSTGAATALAVILGIFGLLGVGHIYIGKVGKGLVYLILGIFLFGVSVPIFTVIPFHFIPSFYGLIPLPPILIIIIYFIVFIWQIISVRKDCEAFNIYFIRTKNRLW